MNKIKTPARKPTPDDASKFRGFSRMVSQDDFFLKARFLKTQAGEHFLCSGFLGWPYKRQRLGKRAVLNFEPKNQPDFRV